ncbi:hypothetical protein AgCh_004310 [Apium graveolens]
MEESAILVSAEEEISSLKSQITSLQKQLVPGAQDVHKDLVVFERETEMRRLTVTELLEKVKNKADCEYKNCSAENSLAGVKREIKIKELSVRFPMENEMPSLETQEHKINRLKESLLKENPRPYSEMTKSYGERKTDDADNCSAGKMDADKETEEKQKELAIRLGFKAEISALKSQIELMQKMEFEFRQKADSEAEKEKEGMQKASEAQKIVKTEKSSADEERRLAAKERKRAEEASLQLGRLRAEVEVL